MRCEVAFMPDLLGFGNIEKLHNVVESLHAIGTAAVLMWLNWVCRMSRIRERLTSQESMKYVLGYGTGRASGAGFWDWAKNWDTRKIENADSTNGGVS